MGKICEKGRIPFHCCSLTDFLKPLKCLTEPISLKFCLLFKNQMIGTAAVYQGWEERSRVKQVSVNDGGTRVIPKRCRRSFTRSIKP